MAKETRKRGYWTRNIDHVANPPLASRTEQYDRAKRECRSGESVDTALARIYKEDERAFDEWYDANSRRVWIETPGGRPYVPESGA